MRVAGLGLSVLKGSAQQHPASLVLDGNGPVGDRRYALVDPATSRVLRTVENPRLLALRAALPEGPGGTGGTGGTEEGTGGTGPETLVVELPGGARHRVDVVPAGTLRADYWGRSSELETLAGDGLAGLTEALRAHLDRDVLLARARPRDVVYGEGVTLVTTSTLAELERRRAATGVGGPERGAEALLADAERWRATVVLSTPGAPPFVEDGWHGRTLTVGSGPAAVVLRVTAGVARCAVVRGRPRDGAREPWDPLRLLAPDRTVDREIVVGVGAEVEVPGVVRLQDEVLAGPAA